MNLKFVSISLLIVFLSSCGFKAVKQGFILNYKINEIDVKGDKKAAFLLKNKFKNQNKNAPKSIDLLINLTKTKNIKEKNIQNEIEQYEIIILVDVEYSLIDENVYGEINLEKKGSYNVSGNNSKTISNEKKLTNTLVDEISKQIIKELRIKFNDF